MNLEAYYNFPDHYVPHDDKAIVTCDEAYLAEEAIHSFVIASALLGAWQSINNEFYNSLDRFVPRDDETTVIASPQGSAIQFIMNSIIPWIASYLMMTKQSSPAMRPFKAEEAIQ